MIAEYFFLLLSATYLAPNLTPKWRVTMGALCLIAASGFSLLRVFK